MASEIMLVNPSPRKKEGKKMSKHRTAAQKRATAKLVAWNKAHRKNPKRKSSKRRRNPAPALAAVANPRRRRRNPSRARASHGRRRRHNPSLRIGNAVSQVVKPAVTQALGGLALDVAMGYIPFPAMLQTGYAKAAAKVAVAVAIGIAGQKVTKGQTGKNLALGAATIAIHDVMKGFVQSTVPSVRLGGSDSEFAVDGLGYTNFAPTFDDSLYGIDEETVGELFDASEMGELFDDGSMGELFTVGEMEGDDF